MKKHLLFTLIILLNFSCRRGSENSYKEDVKLNYNNGKIYCKGYQVVQGKMKYKEGIWNFYWLNGNIKMIREYKYGDIVSEKKYSEEGKITSSKKLNYDTDEEESYIEYYENGNTKLERITKIITEEDDYTTSTQTKTYYNSGELNSLESSDIIKIWDKNGNLVLDHKEQPF